MNTLTLEEALALAIDYSDNGRSARIDERLLNEALALLDSED
jgi:hypothetical protein